MQKNLNFNRSDSVNETLIKVLLDFISKDDFLIQNNDGNYDLNLNKLDLSFYYKATNLNLVEAYECFRLYLKKFSPQ